MSRARKSSRWGASVYLPTMPLGIVMLCALCVLGSHELWAKQAAADAGIVIENETPLPDTYPQANYELLFHAHGGAPPLHWRLEKGAIPPGLKLEDGGLLHGQPEHAGEFQFTISVHDGHSAVQKEFTLHVISALDLNWKREAHVNGNRIEGSVQVSNTTHDDIDLTFVAMAVPANGRAVAIGYQHFLLHRGTVGMELPFGETLPRGGYVVHIDVVGEVAARKVIHRERLQTPRPLQVNVGP